MIQRISQAASGLLARFRPVIGDESWEVVSEPEAVAPAESLTTATAASGDEFRALDFVPSLTLSETQIAALFEADTVAALRGFTFDPLRVLEGDPDFPDRDIGRSRIARAVRAGVGARFKLEGRSRTTCKSPFVSGKKRFYVVLRSRNYPEGFITEDYEVYSREVQSGSGGRIGFDPRGVSHSFTYLAEVVAFLAGAQRGWPQEEL